MNIQKSISFIFMIKGASNYNTCFHRESFISFLFLYFHFFPCHSDPDVSIKLVLIISYE